MGTYDDVSAGRSARTGSYWRRRHAAANVLLDTDAQTHPTPINFGMPAGACDCHVHVFCDPRQFPFSPDRPYTPPPAPVEELRRVLRALHMDRAVIVSPAVYGASNDCTLDAIHRLGSAGRGIALIAPQTPSAERQRLRRGGIRGLRLNFETFGITDPQTAIDRFDSRRRLRQSRSGTFRSILACPSWKHLRSTS